MKTGYATSCRFAAGMGRILENGILFSAFHKVSPLRTAA